MEVTKMGIPESQLKTWSHQGAITTTKDTHNSIGMPPLFGKIICYS